MPNTAMPTIASARDRTCTIGDIESLVQGMAGSHGCAGVGAHGDGHAEIAGYGGAQGAHNEGAGCLKPSQDAETLIVKGENDGEDDAEDDGHACQCAIEMAKVCPCAFLDGLCNLLRLFRACILFLDPLIHE